MILDIPLSMTFEPTMSATIATATATKSAGAMSPTFVPDNADVICGRGKKVFQHRGNVNFRSICMSFLGDYRKANSKALKSAVVSSVFDEVVSLGGSFVKHNARTGQWFRVKESAVREKISQCFRDCLQDKVKEGVLPSLKRSSSSSSSKAKQAIRSALPPPPQTHLSRACSAPARYTATTSKEAFEQLLKFAQSSATDLFEEPQEQPVPLNNDLVFPEIYDISPSQDFDFATLMAL